MGLDKNGVELLEIHHHGADDITPLQMISAALLAHYRRCEAELLALRAKSGALPDVDDLGTPP